MDADGLARALAGAGVGLGALTADGKAAAMADASVAVDGLEAFEIGLKFPAEIAFDGELADGDRLDDLVELFCGEILGPHIGVDASLIEDFFRGTWSDSIDVWKRRFDPFVTGDFDT